jgi:hypothetical protein
MAHDPEVEGSNPSPATKSAGQGPLPILEEGFCVRPVNGFVNALSPKSLAGVVVGSRVVGRCLIAHCSNWCYIASYEQPA